MRLLLLILLNCSVTVFGQTVLFKTKFVPHEVTYNGSPNPNECWESVDSGILVESSGSTFFLLLPASDFERLRQMLTTEEIVVEAILDEESSSDSGARGGVVKITLNGVVIFPEK